MIVAIRKRALYFYALVLVSAFIGACVPAGQWIKIQIDGINNGATYSDTPDFSLNYTESAQVAQRENRYPAFQENLKELQVFLNDSDITASMQFSETYAKPVSAQAMAELLQEGKNTLVVKQKANPQKALVALELAKKEFIYSTLGPVALISSVRKASGSQTALQVEGYVLSEHPIVAITLNGEKATVVNDKFSVQVQPAVNYKLYAENAAGLKSTKNFVTDAYVNNAVRLRFGDNFFNESGLKAKIVTAAQTAVNSLVSGSKPIINTKVGNTTVKVTVKSMRLGTVNIGNAVFSPAEGSIKVNLPLSMASSSMALTVNISNRFSGNQTLNATGQLAKAEMSLNLVITRNAQNKLVVSVSNPNAKLTGIKVSVPGLSANLQQLIAPMINQLVTGSDSTVNTMIINAVQNVSTEVLSKIDLTAALKTDNANLDAKLAKLASDSQNAYVDIQLGATAVSKKKLSIGAMAISSAVPFVTPNKTVPFKDFTHAINATTQRPVRTSTSNLGMAISADVVNQILLAAYQNDSLKMQGYFAGGQLLIQNEEPKKLADLDMRLIASFGAPLELAFAKKATQSLANVVAPNLFISIDLYQAGAWQRLGMVTLMATVPGEIKVSTADMRLVVNKDNFDLKTLAIQVDAPLQVFSPLIDVALTQIKPLIADRINQAAIIKLDPLFDQGFENLDISINNLRNLQVNMKLNMTKLIK